MKKLFHLGICLLVLFELSNVYFIMPLPYSQRVRGVAYATNFRLRADRMFLAPASLVMRSLQRPRGVGHADAAIRVAGVLAQLADLSSGNGDVLSRASTNR